MSRIAEYYSYLELLSSGRALQQLPDYTSPPLPVALEATPEAYRSDDVMDAIRDIAGAGNCTSTGERCHIPFVPPPEAFDDQDSQKVGVLLYGGGLVDPRGYAPLAAQLATRYGIPTVIPIFFADLAFSFGSCETRRLALAQAEFPLVQRWVLAGHSFGGVAAMIDAWELLSDNDALGGLALLAADVQQGLGCGATDFSSVFLPTAAVTASEDGVLNATRWEQNRPLLSNETFFLDVYGGNHGGFGAYDDSERTPLLGQNDGELLIPVDVQWDLAVAAIVHVASRTGVALPTRLEPEEVLCPPDSSVGSVLEAWMGPLVGAALLVCGYLYG